MPWPFPSPWKTLCDDEQDRGTGDKEGGQSEGKRRERSGRRKSENLERKCCTKDSCDDAAIIQKVVINVIRGRRANLLRREMGIREEAREHCQGEKVLVCKSR